MMNKYLTYSIVLVALLSFFFLELKTPQVEAGFFPDYVYSYQDCQKYCEEQGAQEAMWVGTSSHGRACTCSGKLQK